MIYKLDPRTKLISVLLFTVMVFFVDNLFILLCLLIIITVVRQMIKIPGAVKLFKNFAMLAVFIILLQALFGPGENFIVKPLFPDSFPLIGGMGSLKREGLFLGFAVVCRFCFLIILFSVFSETTSPYSLAAGLTSLGFHYITAFIITSAFNLIPFFKNEALTIMDAQKLRGMRSLEKPWSISGLKACSMLALPLVLGAMKKAQTSSVVMDSRAFGVYNKRTWLDKPEMKPADFLFLFACVLFSAVVLFLNSI